MNKFIRASIAAPQINDNGRIVRYMFSDDSVARDNHTINTAGWKLDNFLANPVFLWAHDASALPVGRVVDIGVSNGKLMGDVEYLDRDTYPFADTVYQMVRNGYLNATSVSWLPLEYKFSQDKGRSGGIDFLKQELLEVSQVPVPAMPTALATARANGIDTQPMYEWLERALDTGGLKMVSRVELEELRRAAKMPNITKPKNRAAPKAKKRGLYTVSYLADIVNSLGYITSSAQFEEEYEQDDSKVPAQLLEALKQLGAALVAMTQEEVAELLTGLGAQDILDLDDDMAQEAYVAAFTTPAQRLLRGLEVGLRKGRSNNSAANINVIERFIRAGRVLSADNEKKLRDAHAQASEALDVIIGVCDSASGDDENDDSESATDTSRRMRIARARQLQASAQAAD